MSRTWIRIALVCLVAIAIACVVASVVQRAPEAPTAALAPVSVQPPAEVRPESAHCLAACPVGAPAANDLVVRPIYALSSNDETKMADWAAYRVTRDTIGRSPDRRWHADPAIDAAETLEPDDYDGAYAALGVDRGHQVPLASFAGTEYASETNVMSNITPQRSDLNRGAWARIEDAERDLAMRDGVEAVYVVTGPLYERAMPSLPAADESHAVPSGYWKVIAVAAPTLRVAAFVLDQETGRRESYCGHLVTVDEVEARSGLDLMAGLTDVTEDAVEAGPPALAGELGCEAR